MTNRDIGAYITSRAAGAVQATAGGAGDAAEVDGPYIDRIGFQSGKLVIAFQATLGDGETLSIGANLQDAVDAAGTGVADFEDALPSAVVATGPSGGGTVHGTAELDVNLAGARPFVRAQFTPDLSRANTDVAIVSAALVLGGAERLPAS